MAQTKNKQTEAEKQKKRREQKKLQMRKLRLKLKLNPEALAEKRKKDRKYYYKKKEKGLIKTIKDLTPREQRNLRKKWRKEAKVRRDRKKVQKILQREETFHGTEASCPSPISSPSVSASTSTSRVLVGRKITEKNRRRLVHENNYLKQRLKLLESKVAKLQRREQRSGSHQPLPIDEQKKREKKSKKTAEYIKTEIKRFLTDDENSRITSGKKETRTRFKIKKQIRLLNDTLFNSHKKFNKETNLNISCRTFCRYRPFWVLHPKASSRNTCLCALHENTEHIVKALKNAKIISSSSALDVAKSICCNGQLKETCLERTCTDCEAKKIQILTDSQTNSEPIQYERWVRGQEKLCQKTVKETVKTEKKSLLNLLYAEMKRFMLHICNIYHQHKITKSIKKNLDSESGLLHIDFSENYTCKYSAEVQSAHFGGSKPQVSLHTCVFYYAADKETKNKSYCTLSENLRHDPVLICAHLNPILYRIKQQVPNLKTLHVLSDGPTTQYRNKTMFVLMVTHLSSLMGLENLYWHYSEAGHGKGAPDGVGGCLKRAADAQIALGRDIGCFSDLVSCLQDTIKAIEVIPIDDGEVENIENDVNKYLVRPFKGTMKIHQLSWSRQVPNLVFARRLSCLDCAANKRCPHYELGEIKIEGKVEHLRLEDSDEIIDDDSLAFVAKRPRPNLLHIFTDSDSSEEELTIRKPQAGALETTPSKDPKPSLAYLSWSSDDENIF